MTTTRDPFRLDGKRVLITGASSGLGRATAIAASHAGAEVVMTGRDAGRLHETAQALGPLAKYEVIAADLTSDEDLTRVADASGAVDGIVHAAGLAGPVPIRVVSRSFILDRFDANYFAPVLLTQRFLAKNRLRPDGSIIFLSSISAHTGTRGMSIYSAAKASLVVTAKCLALEVAKHRIRVNCLSPGLVRTPIFKPEEQEWLENEAKRYPLGLGMPSDVANAALFLLSSASRWMTGQAIIMDGACEFV
jgi:NAD(P)-dependent dehydrogenase (short-subunit alcohol dehydrogenase family)